MQGMIGCVRVRNMHVPRTQISSIDMYKVNFSVAVLLISKANTNHLQYATVRSEHIGNKKY